MTKNKQYRLSLGNSYVFEHEPPIITNIKTRFNHTYILGVTGEGKSSLIERMARYDANYGCAVLFIDPTGISCRKLYETIQDKDRITYISIENPFVINPVDKKNYKMETLIQELVQILDVLIALSSSNPESTVLMRQIIGHAMRSIVKQEDKNIGYIAKLLMHDTERKKLRDQQKPNSTEWLFWDDYDKVVNRMFVNKEMIESGKRVAARLDAVSTGEMEKFVVGENDVDIEDIVSNQRIVLVDTSRMNEFSQIYLTNLLVYAVVSYCQFSQSKFEQDPNPLMVYVDEFSIVASILFAKSMISARKSAVGFTVAHQDFSLVNDKILKSVMSNAHTKIIMNCGLDEAQHYSRIFKINEQELLNLPKYTAWIRIDRDNILTELYPPIIDYIPTLPDNIITPKLENSDDLKESEESNEYNFLTDRENSWM